MIIILLLCGWQCFQIARLNDRVIADFQEKEAYRRKYMYLQQQIENNETIYKMQYHLEGKKLEDLHLVDFFSKDTLYLSTLCSDAPILIIYISEQSCTTCYLPYLKRVSELTAKFSDNKFILLADFENTSGLKTMLVQHDIKLKTYVFSEKQKLFDNYTTPTSFLIQSDGTINQVFIPDKSNLSQIDVYLDFIQNKIQ